ncbi:CDK family protein kinase [Angomonas deanei]|uniref:Uncharacterized protein n=1 Tax=Angomonas deanei TaxID=59799 RepID=A0A7G2C528_9TRYP|nr:CDK family protein kinase [Angomonas deanei]CAD2214595.1 hypothetical protein, conserved [Angomonas deanei]|eukprot:EPY22436.1 CDK family protein kinase [Angomonas deanei]
MLPPGKGIRPEEGDSGENSFMDEEEPKKVVRKSYAAAAAAAFLSRKKKMEEEEEEKRKQKLEQKHSSKEVDDATPKRQSTSGIESSSSEVILLQNPKMELFAGANKNNADSYAEAPATEEGAPPKDERRSSSAICITLPSFVSPEATKSNNNNNSTSDVPAAQANEPLDKTSKSLSGSNALNANNKTWIESVRHSLTQHPMYNINLEALYQRNLSQYHYFYEGKTAPASKLNSISQNEKRGASGDRLDETSTSSTVKRNNKNRKDLNLSEEILYRLEQEQKELLEEEEASATDKENKEENDESFFDSSSTPFTTNNNSSTTNHNSSTGNMDRFINVAELDHTFGIIKKQYRNSAGLLPLYSCYLDHRGRIKRLSRLSHSQEEDDPTARAFRSRKSKSKKRKSLFDALPTPTVTDENKEEEVDVTQPHYQQSPHRHSGESNFNSTLYVLKTLQFSPLHIDEWSWTTTHALQTHMNRIQQQEEVGEEEEEFLAMTQHANKLKGNVTNVAAKYRFCGSDSSDNDDDDSMASDNENHPHHAHHRHASLNEATSSHLSDVESGMRDGEDSLWSHDNPNGSGTKHGISPTTRSTSPPPPSFLSSRGMRSPNNNMANTLFISSGTPGSGDRTHPESRAQEKPMLKPFQNIATLLTSPRGNKTTPRPEDNETSGQWYANSHKRNSFLNFTHGLSKESNSTLSVSHPPKGEGKGGAPPLPPRFALPLAPQSNKLDASLLSPEMSAVPELHSLTVESPAPRRTSLLNCSSAVYVKRGSSEGETLMGGRRQRKNSSNRSSGGRNPSVLHASPPPSQPPQKEALNNSIYSFRETSRSNNPNSSFNNNNMRDVLAVFQHEEEKHRLRSINSLQFSGSNLFPDASGANVNDLARHGNYIPPPALSQTNTNQNNATNNNNNNELNSFASISSSLVPNGGRGKNFVERENLEDVLRRANQTNSSFNLNDTSAMLNRSDGSRSPIREEERKRSLSHPIPRCQLSAPLRYLYQWRKKQRLPSWR